MLTTADVRTLVDIGFIALSRGLDKQAELIFAGVQAARPEQEAGPLGAALVALHRNDLDGAIRILRALPPSDAAQTFLGIALSRVGDREAARDILGNVVRTASDAAFVGLAGEALKAIEAGSPPPL